jgi:hypothetical protein
MSLIIIVILIIDSEFFSGFATIFSTLVATFFTGSEFFPVFERPFVPSAATFVANHPLFFVSAATFAHGPQHHSLISISSLGLKQHSGMFGATFIAGSQSFFVSDAAALISCATFLFDSTIQWYTKGCPLMKHCPATFRTIRRATRAKLRDNPCIEQRGFI